LMSNAINYTPPGGIITITTGMRTHDQQEWVTLTVQDTGPGISAADRPHIFERFYRGEAGRKSGAPGTGLGLAICKRIAEKLEGQLTVDSEPGQGTAFTIWLKPA
jgi:signal transduction histidine kinase